MNQTELIPCKFCGEHDWKRSRFGIVCGNCGRSIWEALQFFVPKNLEEL
jgi:ribosomal protein L37AE/L43A